MDQFWLDFFTGGVRPGCTAIRCRLWVRGDIDVRSSPAHPGESRDLLPRSLKPSTKIPGRARDERRCLVSASTPKAVVIPPNPEAVRLPYLQRKSPAGLAGRSLSVFAVFRLALSGGFLLRQRFSQTIHGRAVINALNRCEFAGHTVQRVLIQLTL